MSTARIVYITLIVAIGATFINYIREGERFHIAKVLPFASGQEPGLYDWGAVAMIVITLWGISRLLANREND